MMKVLSVLVIASIFAVLYRKGGDGSGKLYRRIGIPVLATFLNYLAGATWWWLTFPIGFIAFILPITLKGDDIKAYWFNWAWLPVLGVIIGLMLLNLTQSIVFSLCFTVLTVLSNWKKTADIVTWDKVELALGFILGALIAY